MKHEIISIDPTSIGLSQIKTLYAVTNWDWLSPDSEMELAFQGSFRLYGCLVNKKLVGFGRIISDGRIYGLLVDCMVHPEFRRGGIGKALVEHAVNDLRISGLKVIQLLASQEGLPLYQKVGFTTCPKSSPGMIKFLTNRAEQ